jgi:hypothetical protein
MVIGYGVINLRIPESGSLKEKKERPEKNYQTDAKRI